MTGYFCWLPDRDTQRTKSVSELIPCFYIYSNRNKAILFGEKPSLIPSNKAPSEREWQSFQNKSTPKNPILEAYKYVDYIEGHPGSTYQDLADHYNISRARVCQMVSLIKKLPQEITDYFLDESNSKSFESITERRLRPITLLASDKDKIKKFNEIRIKFIR